MGLPRTIDNADCLVPMNVLFRNRHIITVATGNISIVNSVTINTMAFQHD